MRNALAYLLLLPTPLFAQVLVPDLLTNMPAQLNETSGLLMIDGAVWTILDSGNPAAVYAVSPENGSIIRTVDLLGASNVDFEDLAADDDWVYIGDFGNNSGSRTDLRVFRIPRSALEDPGTTEVQVDTIRFSFSDQTDFTPAIDANNFDCEAFVVVDDSLFLFSKRWTDEQTTLYALPATLGDHVAQVRGTFNTNGLVTAASWDGSDRLVLLGYEGNFVQPFIWLFNSVEGHDFFGSTGIRRNVNLFFRQTEGIAWLTPDAWIISNESTVISQPALWSADVGQTFLANAPLLQGPRFFPQPASDELRISGLEGLAMIRVMDQAGRSVISFGATANQPIDAGALLPGMYTAIIVDEAGTWRLPLLIVR